MAYTLGDDSELRQQLREAWRQIADLQWQLQTEQRDNKQQERRLAAQDDVLADALEEHDDALANRDQEIADLEDAQSGRETAWQNERRETRRKSDVELAAAVQEHERFGHQNGNDLYLVQKLLQAYIPGLPKGDVHDEVMHWIERCRVMLEIADTLDGTGGASVRAALQRAVEAYPGLALDVQLSNGAMGREQTILCGLLLHTCLSWTPGQKTAASGGGTQVSIAVDSNTPSRILIAVTGAAATGCSAGDEAMLQSLLALLQGTVESSSGDAGMIVSFPAF